MALFRSRSFKPSLHSRTRLVSLALFFVYTCCIVRADVSTWGNSKLRNSWYGTEPLLTKDVIRSGAFGQIFRTFVVGDVYAQPLIWKGNLLIATAENNIYSLHPVTGAVQWQRVLGEKWNPRCFTEIFLNTCSDTIPFVGIISTGVIDSSTDTWYLTAKVQVGGRCDSTVYRLYAIDVSSGATRTGFPVDIQGSATNIPGLVFDPILHLQRPGLLLDEDSRMIFAAFGAHCDIGNYHGWVAGVSTDGSYQTLWGIADVSGIWQTGGGLTSDRPNQFLFAVGNGRTQFFTEKPDDYFGNAIIRMAYSKTTRKLSVMDYFIPSDTSNLDNADADQASGGVLALPNDPAFPKGRILQIGKSGILWMLNSTKLGRFNIDFNDVAGSIDLFSGGYCTPAAFPTSSGGLVYVAPSFRTLLAIRPSSNDLITLGSATQTAGGGSSSPAVTSNGRDASSALVWMVTMDDREGGNTFLRAFSASPSQDGTLESLWTSPQLARGTKYASLTPSNGRIYYASRAEVDGDGPSIYGFGTNSSAPVLSAMPLQFPRPIIVGSNATSRVTFSASSEVTILSVSLSPNTNFLVQQVSQRLPASLRPRGVLRVAIAFIPRTPSALLSAELIVQTNLGRYTTSVSGLALSRGPLLKASTSLVDLGSLGANSSAPSPVSVQFLNLGSSSLTIRQVSIPSSPFALIGVPSKGFVLASRASVSIGVTLSSTRTAGSFLSNFTVSSSGGNVTIQVKAVIARSPLLSVNSTIQFGSLTVGTYIARSFTVKNTGGIPLQFLKSKPPAGNAVTILPPGIDEGFSLNPGKSLTVRLYVLARAVGRQQEQWIINTNDNIGLRNITFVYTGIIPVGWVSPPSLGTWNTLVDARLLSDGTGILRLTPAQGDRKGVSWSRDLVNTQNTVVSFSFSAQEAGADGLALLLSDPANGVNAQAGGGGGSIAFLPCPGCGTLGIPRTVGVILNTYNNPDLGDISANDVLVNQVSDDGTFANLIAGQNVDSIATLDVGPLHTLKVVITRKRISVTLDGIALSEITDVLLQDLPPLVRLGFSGATGGEVGQHQVWNVKITSTGILSINPSIVSLNARPRRASYPVVNVTLSNTGYTPLRITSVTGPSSPFRLVGAPVAGTVLRPQDRLRIGVTLAPNLNQGSYSSSFTVVSTVGEVRVEVRAEVSPSVAL
mmetsp:Transcript_39743/g.64452  ORF Transcript_39743/g.64452 Transcript_39743/m.64452 type:complete len:1174 (+) Transcript_39743:45-3566(+)|eukprot:CAMPEP_0184674014 /NCGR_PEP_ID=MMETSP0308-20130426/87004_1 /TAXON_ID=38269 /ORGANISM="Gloeochaete witrockiana, Strain SAG 46.84" /LENGTH=1173 /DNA_ID=CAMNT_0027121575 /DNA_START=510 /DNA_END=4031 /DNA_ORIENTATION=-